MMRTSISEVKEYFQRHRIHELLCDLAEELAVKQPDQPIEMLHQRLSNLIEKEGIGVPGNDTAADNDSVSAASSDRAFALQMHVESSGRGGSCVRHISKRSMNTSDETLESWKQDATTALTEAFNCMTGTEAELPRPAARLHEAKGGVEDSDTLHTVLLAIVTDPEGFFKLGAAENLGDLSFQEFTQACEYVEEGCVKGVAQSIFTQLDTNKNGKVSLEELTQTTELVKHFYKQSKCESVILAALMRLIAGEQPLKALAQLSEGLLRDALVDKVIKALAKHAHEVRETIARKKEFETRKDEKGLGKFGTATYGGVVDYVRGLEAVGYPHPNIYEHMRKEATESADSLEIFEAWNSGHNKTSARVEWDFVVNPFGRDSMSKDTPPSEWKPKHAYGGKRIPIRLEVFLHALSAMQMASGILFGDYKNAHELPFEDARWLHPAEVSTVKVVLLRLVKSQLGGVALFNVLSKHAGLRLTGKSRAERANIQARRIVEALSKALHEKDSDGSESTFTYHFLVDKLKGIATEEEVVAILDHYHAKLAEQNMSEAEVIGLREYSGPLYVKINGSLRLMGAHAKMTVILPCALENCTQDFKQKFKEVVAAVAHAEADKVSMDFVSGSELQTSTRIDVRVGVPPQQKEAEEVCKRMTRNAIKTELASKTGPAAQEMSNISVDEAAAVVGLCEHLLGNRYVNTIFATASGMRKLSNVSCIPEGRRVFRGMGGVKLPDEFVTEKEGGGRGGVDFAFMSTTTKREVAVSYIKGKKLPILFECELDDINRGCPLSFVSQFPGEDEILVPAMSYLELIGKPYVMETSEGSGAFVTVYPARIHCNQKSQTIEEIESRRKQEVMSLTFYIEQELHRDLSQVVKGLCAGLSSEQTEALNQAHKKALDDFASQRKEWHRRDAKDFNNDTKYKDDIAEAIDFKVKKIVELGRIAYKANELNADNFMHEAAKKGHGGLITTLVSLGFAVDSKDKDNGFTPLMYASSNGHADTARMLLERGALLESVSKNGQTALQLADNYGKDEVAKVLCNHGARGALHYAIKKDLRDMFAQLIAKGHDLEECNENRRTPLDLAFIYGKEEAVAVLRSHGAQLTHAAQPRVSLHDAAEKGITEEVFAGIVAGQDINACDKHGRAALHYAVRGRHVGVIEALLKAGCIPDIHDEDGATALMIASQIGQVEAVQMLIENGANLELADKRGWTPFDYTVDKDNKEAAAVLSTHHAQLSLLFAAQKGMTDKVAAAIAAGQDINACNSNMETPLMHAIYWDKVETALVLVQMGASLEAVDNRGRAALHYAVGAVIEGKYSDMEERHVGVVEALLKAGCSPEIQDEDGATPLILASESGRVEAVRVLIEKGALIEAVNKKGFTALMIASQSGLADAVRVLIEKGANIEAATQDGLTALMIASANGFRNVEALRLLIDKGALIEAANTHGVTALMIASQVGHVDAVRVLIEKGALIQTVQKGGATALMCASESGREEAVRVLIEKGALIEAANRDGLTALITASQNGRVEAVRVLIEKGANIEASRSDGKTAMQLAEEGYHSKVVALLKEHGAQLSLWYAAAKGMTDELAAGIAARLDINACNSRGRTPLESAVDNDQEEAAAVLRAHGAELSLFFAAEKGMTDEIAAHIAAGQDVKACNEDGRTPLDLALANNQEEAVALLRSNNAVEGKELKERMHKAWRDAGKVVLIDHVSFGALYEDYTIVFGNFNTFKADVKFSAGKFYYELEIKHIRGLAQFGWATEGFEKSTESTGEGVGDNAFSWGFDGVRVSKWGDGSSSTFGAVWQEGDVLGLSCDMVNKTVSFSVNGSFEPPLGVAFENIAADSIAPAFTALSGFKVVANFGHLPFKHAPPDETYVSVHAAAQK